MLARAALRGLPSAFIGQNGADFLSDSFSDTAFAYSAIQVMQQRGWIGSPGGARGESQLLQRRGWISVVEEEEAECENPSVTLSARDVAGFVCSRQQKNISHSLCLRESSIYQSIDLIYLHIYPNLSIYQSIYSKSNLI